MCPFIGNLDIFLAIQSPREGQPHWPLMTPSKEGHGLCSPLLEYFIKITYYCCTCSCCCCCCCNYRLCTVCKSQAYFIMLSPRPSVTVFTLLFLSKQTRHWRNIVSFYLLLFINGHTKCLSCEQWVRS
jgi:hypothetical protein